jgi:hypothetical protein
MMAAPVRRPTWHHESGRCFHANEVDKDRLAVRAHSGRPKFPIISPFRKIRTISRAANRLSIVLLPARHDISQPELQSSDYRSAGEEAERLAIKHGLKLESSQPPTWPVNAIIPRFSRSAPHVFHAAQFNLLAQRIGLSHEND